MYIRDGVLYSYGDHFPLLVRRPWGFLQNADRYSVSTSKHQRSTARHATVLIPFSIFSRINVSYFDIELIDKRSDAWETRRYKDKDGQEHKVSKYQPSAAVFKANGQFYLSSMDGGHYFATLLPAAVNTVKEAYKLLVPFEATVTGTQRQGEWFFVPVKGASKTRKISSVASVGRAGFWRVRGDFLKNRNNNQTPHHKVTEMAASEDGTILVRGTVRHINHDHPMLRLGKVWHAVYESNHIQSYGAIESVD
jgi:hypothetical protein